MKYQTSQFRNGLKVEVDGNPYVMTYFQFVKPGKGTAFTRTKLKNMLTGAVIERTYRTGETLQAAEVENTTMEFLYKEGEAYNFMDMETYEQVAIQESTIEAESKYLTENLQVEVLYYKNRPVSITLPNFIEAEISFCEPGIKGNTATGGNKPAKLSCGASVQVPLFVEQGEWIRVDTRTNEYVSRVKK
ncbi:MAG: elongation factor P [Myxococcota bacterium]|nr:elongation factor P [Myxococcota bacterium]